MLELILSGEVPIPGGVALLAGQWLEGAARAGCRVPARLLPRLLDLGSVGPPLHAALRAVVGPRGRWLAGHHDRWRWAAGEPVGDLDGRCAALRHCGEGGTRRRFWKPYGEPMPPGAGIVELDWKSDPAAERAALLAVLAVGLSDDDEPFLEAALDDRSAGVRQVAVDLLGRLPASRRAARMAERLQALVRSEVLRAECCPCSPAGGAAGRCRLPRRATPTPPPGATESTTPLQPGWGRPHGA